MVPLGIAWARTVFGSPATASILPLRLVASLTSWRPLSKNSLRAFLRLQKVKNPSSSATTRTLDTAPKTLTTRVLWAATTNSRPTDRPCGAGPRLDHATGGARDDYSAIWAENKRGEREILARDAHHAAPPGAPLPDVPELQSATIASGDKHAAIRAEGKAADSANVLPPEIPSQAGLGLHHLQESVAGSKHIGVTVSLDAKQEREVGAGF